ncbi:ParA family protein (plasmid) [Arthrobacter sp. KN11-1C]|uniref:ParA family protein n=1 Tax=Arthrobacter sp. KN11-1C TaxID=3445774 RepID=UPI003FA0B39B
MDTATTSRTLSPAVQLASRRTICISNGKGGVGKTTVTTNLAALLAEAGYKVLVVDLDSQGDTSTNLGIINDDRYDRGEALDIAVRYDKVPVPIKDVRLGLDVLAGGNHTAQLMDTFQGDASRQGKMRGGVARTLAKIAPNYDVVLIDTPPSEAGWTAIEEAMLASRWILAPVKPEPKSIRGLQSLARRIVSVQDDNPAVSLLGVILFGIPTNATNVDKQARTLLQESLDGIAPVFEGSIRDVVAADADASFRGLAAHELAARAATQSPFWERLRNKGKSTSDEPRIAQSAGNLAEDYMRLTEQIVNELQSQEEALDENLEVATK